MEGGRDGGREGGKALLSTDPFVMTIVTVGIFCQRCGHRGVPQLAVPGENNQPHTCQVAARKKG